MATTATPYGATPVGGLSSNGSYSGRMRTYDIASGYNTSIFAGDFVKLAAAGVIQKDVGTTALTPIGIFMGCKYTPASGQQEPTWSDFWPADTVASDAIGFVVDDPDITFKMQADGAVALTERGSNFAVVQTAGSTTVGVSKNAVDADTSATTNTLPLRLVAFVDGPDSAVGDAYTDCIMKFNAGHQLTNTTGI